MQEGGSFSSRVQIKTVLQLRSPRTGEPRLGKSYLIVGIFLVLLLKFTAVKAEADLFNSLFS